MRILQVSPRYYPYIGGVETHVKNISERLAKRNSVSVFTTFSSGHLPSEEVVNDVFIKRFSSWDPNDSYCFSRSLRNYLKNHCALFDVVHAHGYHGIPAYYTAAAKKENPFVFTPHYHGVGHTFFRNLLHKPYKILGKKIFARADRIVCVSDYEKNLVMIHFNVRSDEIDVIPNGINIGEFKGLEKREKGHKLILYVGRLEEYKGVQFIIKALKMLGNDVFLDIVGKGSYKTSLVQLAREMSVSERVRFYQDLPRTELLQKYADADLFVLLSRYEAFGISVAEALASRTPCVVSNTSALAEWIDNTNCFGVNYPVKIEELSRTLNEVIGKRVGEVKLWDWDDVVRRLTEVYDSLVN